MALQTEYPSPLEPFDFQLFEQCVHRRPSGSKAAGADKQPDPMSSQPLDEHSGGAKLGLPADRD
jgi:hypothetical protein